MPGRGNQKQHPIPFLHVSELGTIQRVHVAFLRVEKRAPIVHSAGGRTQILHIKFKIAIGTIFPQNVKKIK